MAQDSTMRWLEPLQCHVWGTIQLLRDYKSLGHGHSPNITEDEEAPHRPWTSKDVVEEIEELKKHYAANYAQDVNPGEDDKKEIVEPGEHQGRGARAGDQDSSQPGPHGEPQEDSFESLFADLASEEKEPWTPIEVQAWDAMDKVAELKSVKCQGDVADIRDSYEEPSQS